MRGARVRTRVRPLRLRALLAQHEVVVVPGFLARGDGDAIVSLGRGGSDLTAVLLAAGLRANRCELIKDVPGYFTADPAPRSRRARTSPRSITTTALAMADAAASSCSARRSPPPQRASRHRRAVHGRHAQHGNSRRTAPGVGDRRSATGISNYTNS